MLGTPALALVALAIGLAGATVQAEARGAPTGGLLRDAIANCRVLTTAIARLDCYDAIALAETEPAATDSASSAKAVTSRDPEARAAPDEEAEFGFEFNVGDALQALTSDVTRVQKNARGGLVLTLANGQVWQQNDGQTLFLDEGDSVTITRGALSAFYLTRDGKGRRYKFSRIQ